MTKLTKMLALMLTMGLVFALSGIASGQDLPGTDMPSVTPVVPVDDPATAPVADGEKVVYTVGSTSDLVSPNPFKACCALDYEMIAINYDLLFNFDQDTLAPVSGIGIWPPTVSEDNKTWTIKIQEGLKWNDGTPLTAHDVAFTYNFISDNNLAVFSSYLGDPASFTAPDDTTLIWQMTTPTLSPLTPPWIPIVPEHIWGPLDGKPASVIKEFKNIPAVGSGPFKLVEWQEGQFVRFERNQYFRGPEPVIDESIYRVYGNPEALSLALETGEIDFAYALTPALFNNLQGAPNIETVVANITYYDNLAFNFKGSANPAFKDERVRDAIALAIDRQTLVDRVLLGNGTIGDSTVLPWSTYYTPPVGDEVQGFDPEAAKRLLDEAGYVDEDGDGVREGPDGPLTIELLTISDLQYSTSSGKLIAGWLSDIGFDATVKTVGETKAYDLWGSHDFDAYLWGFGGEPDPDFILSIYTSKQCGNWSDGCYSDPAYDKMWEEQHKELDPEAREAQVAEMQRYLYDKNVAIILFYERDLDAYRTDTFEGYVLNPAPVGAPLFQYGPYSYLTLKPVAADSPNGTGSSDGGGAASGIPTWAWIVIALVVIGVIVLLVARRSGSQDTTE